MSYRENQPAGAGIRWGIRDSTSYRGAPKSFALLAGAVYVVIGIFGFFFTGFNNFTEMTDESLFGIFHLTPFHNIVHLGVGALWLLAAFLLTQPGAEGVNFGIGGVYVLAAILGYLGYLNFLGIRDPMEADNYLHLITGVVSLIFAGIIPFRSPVPA